MTTTEQRSTIMTLIDHARSSGARLHQSCQQIGITCRTLQRWARPSALQTGLPATQLAPQQAQQQQEPQASVEAAPAVARAFDLPTEAASEPPTAPPTAPVFTPDSAPVPLTSASPATLSANPCEKPLTALCADRRQSGLRTAHTPHNKLTPQECDTIMATLNSDEFKDLPASQIVPRLADQGLYLASESSMQRLLRKEQQNAHRRGTRPVKKRNKPFALKATMVNQVYTWDITYLPTTVKGQYFYMYVFVDIFSRFIVGAQVFACESADFAAAMIKDICERFGIEPGQIHLHSDNGSPMKGQSMVAMLHELGVIASRSRPAVSNDNPYSESLFATLKHRPLMPVKPFDCIDEARLWAVGLVDWYNKEHYHSGIKFVTPEQRHYGQDEQLLQKRDQLYSHARERNPQRWSKNTRNWQRVNVVHLNPDKPDSKGSH